MLHQSLYQIRPLKKQKGKQDAKRESIEKEHKEKYKRKERITDEDISTEKWKE